MGNIKEVNKTVKILDIKYILFKSEFAEYTYNPSEELQYILAETDSEEKANELLKNLETLGERGVIQKYQVNREDGFKRYILIE